MRQLHARNDVTDGIDAIDVGSQPIVGEHEAAFHRDALCLVAEVCGVRPSADRNQEDVGVVRVTGLDGDGDPASS